MTLWMPPKAYHLVFPMAGLSITPIIEDVLWQGATPRDGSSFEAFAGGRAKIFCLMAERTPQGMHGCTELRHYPLDDNVGDRATTPPTLRGMTLGEVFGVMREVADRVYRKAPTVVLCRMGLSRSSLIVGGALRLLGHEPDEVIRIIRGSRGPQALTGNANFRAMITGARRV